MKNRYNIETKELNNVKSKLDVISDIFIKQEQDYFKQINEVVFKNENIFELENFKFYVNWAIIRLHGTKFNNEEIAKMQEEMASIFNSNFALDYRFMIFFVDKRFIKKVKELLETKVNLCGKRIYTDVSSLVIEELIN